jgi:methyl-accepting chemotaxis protein
MADDLIDEILAEMRREHDECSRRITREHEDLLAQIQRERAEWLTRVDRRLDQSDDMLRFVGELNRRGEIALQDLLRGTTAMRAEIRQSIKESKASVQEIKANTETSKAHTRAIFALIDRLEGGSGPLSPAG